MCAAGMMYGSQAMGAISTTPVTANPTEAAQKLYTFLYENYGKKTISGVQTGDLDASTLAQYDLNAVYEKSGKYPALIGLDFLMTTGNGADQDWFKNYTQTAVTLAKLYWQKGGIPTFTWHWKPYDDDESCYVSSANTSYTDFDYSNAFVSGSSTEWNTSSTEYQQIIKGIDVVSAYLLDLQKSGVAVIWRPLHEAAGGWFWWGRTSCGPEKYKALYQLMYDRMVNYNGVKNLIWVWNIERDATLSSRSYNQNDLTGNWYPGDKYVDVIGVDVYQSSRYDYTSKSEYFKKIQEVMGTDKILAMTETGSIQDPANMENDGAVWSWWMPWYNSWAENKDGHINWTSDAEWTSAMADDRIITLEDMSDWDTYIDACDTLNTTLKKEAECADYNGSIITQENMSGTGIVNMEGDGNYVNFTFDLEKGGHYKVYVGFNEKYGNKQFNCSVNGAENISLLGPNPEDGDTITAEVLVGKYELGTTNTISFTPDWGWVPIDYARIEEYDPNEAEIDPCDTLNTAFKIEAECADYSDDAVVISSSKCSNKKAIGIIENAGYINFKFDVETAGLYKIIVAGDTSYGSGKMASVEVDGASATITINNNDEITAGSFRLAAGENTISVVPGWTYWIIDYVRIEADAEGNSPVTPAGLVTANATAAAQEMYDSLVVNFGKKTISGFMTGDMSTANGEIKSHEDIQAVYTKSGYYPALVGFDFMNATGKSVDNGDSWYINYTASAIALAKNIYSLGGYPAFTWHWRDPSRDTDQFYVKSDSHTDGTTVNFTDAMNADGTWNTTSTLYQNMIKDIDAIAEYFLDLQANNIAAIFRPLHEASGAWFWWGTQGGENYAKLYRLIYDEMVTVKGVKNIIWVWNPEYATDSDWNPGSSYYDVVSIDIYNSAYDYQSNYIAFNNLKSLSSSSKLIALSENGPVPDVTKCFDEGATWSWWMPWYQSWSGNFANQTSDEEWKAVMSDDRIITLEDMNGWGTGSGVKSVAAASNIIVFPSKVNEALFVVCNQSANVVVCDAAGNQMVNTTVADGGAEINASNWSNGVYVVKVTTANDVKTYKVVK